MRTFYLVIAILSLTWSILLTEVNGQHYIQQEVAFSIEASIDTNHLMSAVTEISYTHRGESELDTFYLHLWMNAFKDRLSAYSDQSIRIDDLDYYFAKQKFLGGYQGLSVYVDDKKVDVYAYDGHKDVTYFLPSKPIKKDQTIEIRCQYDLQLPKKFSRAGYTKDDVYLTYWYPTPAVYDANGWHPMPYLSMGETYTEIADYNIDIEIPNGNLVASVLPQQSNDNKYSFSASQINDFAIVYSQSKKVVYENLTQNLDHEISVNILTDDPERAKSTRSYLKKALPYFEEHIGPFPFNALSIVDKGADARSGMEYPGLVTISGADDESGNMEYYLIHELLHQYFYAALASDQRSFAWMDEGLTTYYQQRYYRDVYDLDHYSRNMSFVQKGNKQPFLKIAALAQAKRHFNCPLHTSSEHIDPMNYGFNAYEIPARMFQYLEAYMQDDFDVAIKDYFNQWNGKHPQPSDLQVIMEKAHGNSLSWFFNDQIENDWTYDYKIDQLQDGVLTVSNLRSSVSPIPVTLINESNEEKQLWLDGHSGKKDINVGTEWVKAILDQNELSLDIDRENNYANVKRPIKFLPLPRTDQGDEKEVYVHPFVSYNTSDGPMLGGVFYNSSFPSKRLKWLVNPSYAVGSKKLVGEAWASYDHYIDHPWIRKFKYGLNAKRYSFRFSETLESRLTYFRINPTFSLHLKNKDLSSKYSKVYFKPIFINEEFFQFDSEGGFDIRNSQSTIVRLGYEYYNFWNLGPSEINVQLEYQPYENLVNERHQYTKLTASYKKSFKYAPERSVDFRLWGTYFLTNSQRQSANYDSGITRGSSALIYQGFNDYAYDDYFFNRDNQGAPLDNQISYAGGGFKVPLGSQYSIGQTNDFGVSINIETDFPIKLPKFLPVRLFVDAGYYTNKLSEEDDLVGRSLLSGGLMLSFGEGVVNVYLPLVNSADINEIYDIEGINGLGRISFRIDLHRYNPWDILEDFLF